MKLPECAAPCTFCGLAPERCPHLGPACSEAWTRAEERGAVPVVATVVRRGSAVLLCRRPAHKRHGGLWEFPGGKLLPNETLGEAVGRELAEELELRLDEVVSYLGSEQDPGAVFLIHFVEALASGDPASIEHEEVAWVTPAELNRFDLAPGDHLFIQRWRRSHPNAFS
jgi:8-oxo-dGTP diphosphatase